VLRKLGYRPRLRLTPAQEAAHLRYQCEYNFDRSRGRLSVEIHWDIAPRDFSFRIDMERVWTAVRPIPVDGMTVLAPRPEDLLLMLAVHGSKHLWERIGWLADVAELVRIHPGLDWPAVRDRARERGGERMLLLALRLAGDLLAAPLPAWISDAARSDPAVAALARRIVDCLARGDVPPERSGQALRFHLRMRERLRDRISRVFRLAATPTFEDWTWVRLPPRLLRLHYVLRPIRLAAKHGGVLLR
jgi:hypothetical protein